MKTTFKRLCSFLLSVTMIVCLLPGLEASVSAETGYDRGYVGGMPGDGVIYAHGLDVSAWQESGLDFQNFANAGYDYVILRCGTSYGKDKCFDEYYASAKAAGLDVGCYYYSYATSVSAARTDANNMLSWMAGKVFEYPVYFDYEDSSQSGINGTDAASICLTFMDMLKAKGYLVGLYSMSSWLNQSWVTTSGIRSTYEGWVAHLPSTANNTGITSDLYLKLHSTYSKKYGMHQYSFTTYVNGQGPFDANVCYKDYPSIVKTFGFNGYEQTETWIEKACFDVMVYRDRNKDISHLSDAELKKHWLEHGIKEGRPSSVILDLGFYRSNNPDLKEAFGDDWEAIYEHFITKGYQEHRKSSALFDGSYYCEKYPDVKSNYKEKYLLHYVDHGMREGRRASLTYDPDYYLFIRPDVAQTWPNDYTMAAKHYAGHGINAQTVAYDHSAPVISDVKISDVGEGGYTVSCTVKDDWQVNKVVFPTWTLLNGQDDLAEQFMETQKGTKNGNTYTFRVDAADHNWEGGQYITHIYAVDRGGNRTQLVLDVVEVKGKAEFITTVAGASYSVSGGCLKNVKLGTTVQAMLAQLEDSDLLKVISADGIRIGGSATVHTGARVELWSNGVLVDTVTVAVRGDLDGNGAIDSTDYLRVKATFLEKYDMSDVEYAAGDVDGDGVVNTTDYLRIKEHFLGTYDLLA